MKMKWPFYTRIQEEEKIGLVIFSYFDSNINDKIKTSLCCFYARSNVIVIRNFLKSKKK